jgi:hypothetical protein
MMQKNKQLVELAAGYRAGGWLAKAPSVQPKINSGSETKNMLNIPVHSLLGGKPGYRDVSEHQRRFLLRPVYVSPAVGPNAPCQKSGGILGRSF